LTNVGAARSFMIRRFWRVWPLHFGYPFAPSELAKLAIGLVAPLPTDEVPFTGSRSIGAMLTNLVMLQSLNLHGTTTWMVAEHFGRVLDLRDFCGRHARLPEPGSHSHGAGSRQALALRPFCLIYPRNP